MRKKHKKNLIYWLVYLTMSLIWFVMFRILSTFNWNAYIAVILSCAAIGVACINVMLVELVNKIGNCKKKKKHIEDTKNGY